MAPADDERWLVQAQLGDRQAFAALVNRYWGRVQRWLAGLTDSQTAEDLTQEVFLKAWLALPALQARQQFRAWLFRIARNCWIDSRRAEKKAQPLPAQMSRPQPGPEAPLVVQENHRLLEEACARLPPLYRAAFLLWSREDFSYTQIADALAITEETARWRVFKARQSLVRALGRHLD